MQEKSIYVASKTRHAPMWRALRSDGHSIGATWIDEAGADETTSFGDLWTRCIDEVRRAGALIGYWAEGDKNLKGTLVEIGAALAARIPVFLVGDGWDSYRHHPSVTMCSSLDDALAKAYAEIGMLLPVSVRTTFVRANATRFVEQPQFVRHAGRIYVADKCSMFLVEDILLGDDDDRFDDQARRRGAPVRSYTFEPVERIAIEPAAFEAAMREVDHGVVSITPTAAKTAGGARVDYAYLSIATSLFGSRGRWEVLRVHAASFFDAVALTDGDVVLAVIMGFGQSAISAAAVV